MCILVQLYIHYIFCSAKVFIWIIVFHLLPSLLSGTAIYFMSLSDMCSIIMLMVRNFQNFAWCIDISPPQSPSPPTHTHSLHFTSSNCKGFWPVNHFTMLLHDCSFSSGHIRSHVCVGLWLCIPMMCILNLR